MLVGIIADLHANLEASWAVLRRLDELRPDRVVCLGDLTGYNANPNEVIDLIREREIPCLMGNHDAAACGLEEPWFFNARAKAAIEWHAEVLRPDNRRFLRELPAQLTFNEVCLGVHGAPGNRDDYIVDWLDAMRQIEYLPSRRIRLCFFGHSHHASLFGERGAEHLAGRPGKYSIAPNGRYFINPGSVGQPRDHNPRAAFGVLDTEAQSFEFYRVEYDIAAAARKVHAAGLPPELGERLTVGR